MKKILSNKKYAPLLIVIAAVLWGLDGLIRQSLYSLSPLVIVFSEHVLGSLIIAPFVFPLLKKTQFTRKEWGALLWISLVSGLLGTLWFTQALMKTNFIPFSVVFLLQKLQPLFAILMAVVLLKEKLTKNYWIWAVLALIGGFFLTFPEGKVNFSQDKSTLEAAGLAILAAIAWGSSTAVSRYALMKKSNTLITGMRFFMTSLWAFIGVVLMNQFSMITSLSFDQFSRLIFIALSTGMVALWLYYKGLKQTKAKVSTILELALPITAIIIDLVWFKKTLIVTQYLAAVLMLFAMYRVTRESN